MKKKHMKNLKKTFSIENIRRLVRNNVKSFGGDFRRAFNSEFKWVNVRMLYSEEYVRKIEQKLYLHSKTQTQEKKKN